MEITEDALGGEQGFKGPASFWMHLVQQRLVGAEWDGEPKGCSLSLAPQLRGALRRAAGRSGGGSVGKNKVGRERKGSYESKSGRGDRGIP